MQQDSGSRGSSGGGDDTESQDEDQAEEGEGLVRSAVPQKSAPQPVSLKAAAQHRRQRLRELQAAQQLAATLGSASGGVVAHSHEKSVQMSLCSLGMQKRQERLTHLCMMERILPQGAVQVLSEMRPPVCYLNDRTVLRACSWPPGGKPPV